MSTFEPCVKDCEVRAADLARALDTRMLADDTME
jgi:hypothetical protein